VQQQREGVCDCCCLIILWFNFIGSDIRAKVTECFQKKDIEKLNEVLEIGDLLEFQRTGFAHWAVHVGKRKLPDGTTKHSVIHRAIPTDADKKTLFMASTSIQKAAKVSASTTNNIGHIILESIESVLADDRVRINNGLDKKMKPKNPTEIIGRAEKKLKNAVNEKPYNLVTNNCEHFVNTCRYGVHMSLQVKDTIKKTAGTAAGIAGSFATRVAIIEGVAAISGLVRAGPVGWIVAIGGAVAVPVITGAVHGIQCRNKK